MDKQVEFLVKFRDASLMLAEAANEYIDELAPAGMQARRKQTNPHSPRIKLYHPKI